MTLSVGASHEQLTEILAYRQNCKWKVCDKMGGTVNVLKTEQMFEVVAFILTSNQPDVGRYTQINTSTFYVSSVLKYVYSTEKKIPIAPLRHCYMAVTKHP